MKKIALPLVLVALSLVVVLIWRVATTPVATAPEAAAVPGEAASKLVEPENPLPDLDAEAPDAAESGRADLPAVATTEKGLETWEISKSIWVEGVVRIPDGCADEGPIEVLATSEPQGGDDIARLLDRDARSKVLLSRRELSPEGAFRIPFPPDAKVGHVSLRGRFLYLPESLPVDLAAASRPITLEPRCGAWIRGTIGLPSDSPVAISALDGEDVDLRSSIQNVRGPISGLRGFRRKAEIRDGTFEFKAVPSESPSTLEIGPDRLAATIVEIEKPRPGTEVPVRIELLRGGTVRGVVRDEGGQPVAGAEVEAALPGMWFGFDNREVRSGKSGQDGAFELEAVAPGDLVLRASLEHYLQSEQVKVALANGGVASGVELTLTRGEKVSGTVAWADGKPAAAVAVQAGFDRSQLFGMGAFNAARGANGSALTDEQGAFTITGLGKGPFTLQVQALPPGEAAAEPTEAKPGLLDPELPGAKAAGDKAPGGKARWRARADGVQPGATGVALVLKAPAGVPGRVVDEKGEPVAKFKIQSVRQGQGPMGNFGEEERSEAFEDENGRFLVTGLIEGTWHLHAIAEGFGLPDPVVVEIPRAADAPEISIAIEHSASAAGVVKSPGGALVAGAVVEVHTGEPSWKGMIQSGPKPPRATSHADGTFRLDGLRSGKFQIAASSKEYAKSLPVDLELTTGQHATGIEITLRQGGTLTGEVYADNGKPATGMFVQAVQMKDFDSQMAFTGSRGEFRIENLLPGSWQVIAMPSKGEGSLGGDGGGKDETATTANMLSKMKMTVATIVDGEETHVVLGAPPKAPVEVHGTVTHSGEPCAGSMVAFVPEGKEPLKGMKSIQVGKDGTYSVRLDAAGKFSVSVQQSLGGMGQQSTVEFSKEIPEQKEYRLDLAMPTGRVSGRVLSPDGEPAAGARVSLHPETPLAVGTMWGGQYHEGVTDGEGRYDVKMLRAGTYTLAVGGLAFSGLLGGEASHGREIRGGIKLSDGEWIRDLDFRLKKPGSLDVIVVDAAGDPVSEASVFARDANGRLVDGLSMVATDATGKAQYKGLGPGTYTIVARKDLLTSTDSAQAKVDEGGSAEVRVALQPGTIVVVTCLGGEESKPIQASVSVQDENGREVSGMIALSDLMKMFGENGFSTTEHRIGPLPQGKYTVRAAGPDGRIVSKPVSLTGQSERKLTLRFD